MEKRHTPKPGFPFIVDNEFDIDNYQFPELPSMFLEIDRPMGEDDITKTDFTRIFRRVADEIGRSIQDAFHFIPPNGVLAEISRKFKSLHPVANANFLIFRSYNPNIKFGNIGELMKQSLAKWKMARSHRLKRADAWQFRPGPSFARLEESHKLRVQIRAEERANKRPVKIQLVEAQMENAQLKALLEEKGREIQWLSSHQTVAPPVPPPSSSSPPPSSPPPPRRTRGRPKRKRQ